jgi:hypothetical protein
MTATDELAGQTWLALCKGVRAVSLYAVGHREVVRWVDELVGLVRRGCSQTGLLVFEFTAAGVECDGVLLGDREGQRGALVQRLFADGVLAFRFGESFDAVSASRLLEVLAPYAFAERAPLQPLSAQLHWEAFDGLSCPIRSDTDGQLAAVDLLTAREQRWMEELGESVDPRGPLAAAALEPVWDGTGGLVRWPPRMSAAEAEELDAEVVWTDGLRVSLSHLGALLAVAIAESDGHRVDRLLAAILTIAHDRLRAWRPAEIGTLLESVVDLAREERGAPEGLRERVLALADRLAEPDCMLAVAEAAHSGHASPEDLVTWSRALTPEHLGQLLGLAAAMPAGPYREELVLAAVRSLGRDPSRLRATLLEGSSAAAQVAFDVMETLRTTRDTVSLALEVLRRDEPELQVRAIGYLMPLRSRTVASYLTPLLRSERRGVRSGAMTYMARYAYRPAFPVLRDLTTSGLFGQLSLLERLEVCRTFGVVGGDEAAAVARTHLPTGWARLDKNRSAPWIVCLAATGVPDAADYLEAMANSSEEAWRGIAREATSLWSKRRKARGGPPRPPLRTAPGAPVPQPGSEPGHSIVEGLEAATRSHRAPSRSGQWPLASALFNLPVDEEEL